MAAGIYGFRVKVDASGVKSGLKRKFILHIDYLRHKTICDIVRSVQDIIKCKKTIVLFVDEYYLPASESIHALRDGDEITVFCEAAFSDDIASNVVPEENVIEDSEQKKHKKHKKEAISKYEKKQKRKKRKHEISECVANISNINSESDIETFNPDTIGNLESEQGSMLVNCSSLIVSSDECQADESQVSVKAPEIETKNQCEQIKSSIEKENVKQKNAEENLGAAPNRYRYNKTIKHLKNDGVGHLIEILKATETDVAHAFTHKTDEPVVKQENASDALSFKESGLAQTVKKTDVTLVDEADDTEFLHSQAKHGIKSSLSQCETWAENKRKRKRKRTHKKNKIQKLDSQNHVPVKNFAGSEIKTRESQSSASRKHIRFAEVEENIEADRSVMPSENAAATENLEDSVNTTVTDNVPAETSEEPVVESITLNSSFTSSQENKADELEQNASRQSTQWDVKPDFPDANAFSKLLSLGWSSTPVVYQRKRPTKTETSSVIPKEEETKKVENMPQGNNPVNGHTEMNGMNLTADTSLTTESILKYPVLESLPRKKDILAFKILRMGENYTPELSEFIIAEVKHFCTDSQQVELNILQGAEQCAPPKGKFCLEEEEENNSKAEVVHLNWNELIGTRILYP